MYICAKYSGFLCNLVEKMWLFNREVRYQVGSGSETIYSGSGSGSFKKFRIRIHNTIRYSFREGSWSTFAPCQGPTGTFSSSMLRMVRLSIRSIDQYKSPLVTVCTNFPSLELSLFDWPWAGCVSNLSSQHWSQINADPDPVPGQTLKSQKVEFLHENVLKVPYLPLKIKNFPTKVRKPSWKAGNQFFLQILVNLQGPGPGSGSAFPVRIRI
jgi:hypothetical protein